MYLQRAVYQRITHLLTLFPAIALTGPRQSGKTTLLQKELASARQWINFDDPLERRFFESDPTAFMLRIRDGAVIDEAQKAPEIFEYLKMEIDNERHPGRFILTGSSQFTFVRGISESLAGRIAPVRLLPFEWRERKDLGSIGEALLFGNYPELVTRGNAGSSEWFSAYLETYLERDIRFLRDIGNLRDLLRFIQLLAARCSQELNMSVYARELGVSEKTIQAWVSVLEASYIVFLVPAFHKNYGKRIIKRPKLYFWDTGIVNHLTGIETEALLEKGPMAGPIFENFVASEILKRIYHTGSSVRLYWLRTNGGLEIDFILEDTAIGQTEFLEVKRNQSCKPEMFSGLKRILSDHDSEDKGQRAKATLIYQGESRVMGERLQAVNFVEYLEGA